MRAVWLVALAGCAWVSESELAARQDRDLDGHRDPQWGGQDCDDDDPAVHPDAAEVWYDGFDQDCDRANDYDQDGDHVVDLAHGGSDCDDTRSDVNPSLVEFTDGRDNDCDGETDEVPSVEDVDGDGFSEADGDCDDADDEVFPGAEEVFYDGIDQDCDPGTEHDQDEDGHDAEPFGGDCDDFDPEIHPGAPEGGLLDGVDQNCNGNNLW